MKMFGVPARMFPRAPLWLSTGLVAEILHCFKLVVVVVVVVVVVGNSFTALSTQTPTGSASYAEN